MRNWQSQAHVKHHCRYHVVIVPKYRKKAINVTLSPELSIVPPQELLDALAQTESDQPGNDIMLDKLLDLQAWMRSISSPEPGGFDEEMAAAGFQLFHGDANCSACHATAEFTGPDLFMDITVDPPTVGLAGGIHMPGLRGISQTAPYFHDSSAATLDEAVLRLVERGDPVPPLSMVQQMQLVEYLKSL